MAPIGGFVLLRRFQKGVTVMELLIVIGILIGLAALILPALAEARRRPYQTVAVSRIHQTGVALFLYSGDNDAKYVPGALDPLVDGKYIVDRRILMAPGDPYSDGYGFLWQRNWNHRSICRHTSYESMFADMPGNFFHLDDLLQHCANPGVIVSRIVPGPPGILYPEGSVSGSPLILGPILRFHLDGSVKCGRYDLHIIDANNRGWSDKNKFCEDFPWGLVSPFDPADAPHDLPCANIDTVIPN
jgi:hypothetical protein